VRADGGSDAVVGCLEVDDPGAHGFVDGVLESLGARGDRDDLLVRKDNTIKRNRQSTSKLAESIDESCLPPGGKGGRSRTYLSSEHLDPEDVKSLPTDVLLAHVDLALHAESGAGGSGGDSVLAGSGLGDDGILAESTGEEDLRRWKVG
jgi:hypothetical protein